MMSHSLPWVDQMFNWLIFCSFIISLTMTLIGLVVDLSYQIQLAPELKRLQNLQQEQLDIYLQDRQFFSTHNIFKKSQQKQKDLSPFLNQIIEKNDNKPFVDFETKKKVLSFGDQWLEKRHLVEPTESIDQLFASIHNFDFWSADADQLKNQNLAPADFIVASQIYLANSFHFSPDHILVSLEQNRHLSHLLINTEVLNLKLAALSLLEKEHDLIDFMIRRKKQGHQNWILIKKEEIKRFRKFLEKTAHFLSYATKPQVLETVFLEKELPLGACAIYNSKSPSLFGTRSYLEPQFPFEPRFDKNILAIDKITQRLAQFCDHLTKEIKQKDSLNDDIPYYRRIVAIKMLLQKSRSL